MFNKKDSGMFIMEYEYAVEEALCYGWIDSLIKKIDDKQYCRKFSVRKEESKWSETNKKRIEKLEKENRLKPSGKRLVEMAKKNGQWDKKIIVKLDKSIPELFLSELKKNQEAYKYYSALPENEKNKFHLWVNTAKRDLTKSKRIKESVLILSKKEKLGLK